MTNLKQFKAKGYYIDTITLQIYEVDSQQEIVQKMNIKDILPDYKHKEYVIHGKDPDERYLISVRVPFDVVDLL